MMIISLSRKFLTIALLCAVSVSLIACETTAPEKQGQSTDRMGALLKKAAADAKDKGNIRDSLNILERIYKRDSDTPATAMKYAHALREEGYFSKASLILTPFAKDEALEDTDLMIEYAAIQAAMGNYMESEESARRTVLLVPESGKAYHILGIALDAQGHHEQAQVAFKKALAHWEGDPSPLLNNMGLNLAAQGFLDEAIETLRKALDTAPNRTEIEKNLRIVSALQYQPPKRGLRLIPKPPRKPDAHE